MRKIRVALVGVGGWGKNLARVLASLEEVDFRALCDGREKRARYYGETYHVRWYVDVD